MCISDSLWGVMPVYWKLLSAVPAFEVLAWRMVWSLSLIHIEMCIRDRAR